LLEFGDRGIVCFMHRPGRMPVSAGNFPAKLSRAEDATSARFLLPQSGSVPRRSTEWRSATPGGKSGD
jgi:hypothetical protein